MPAYVVSSGRNKQGFSKLLFNSSDFVDGKVFMLAGMACATLCCLFSLNALQPFPGCQ